MDALTARQRPFQLLIDSGNRSEPRTRYFATLDAALNSAESLDSKWHPHIWVTEFLQDGGRRTHVRNGKRVTG